MQSNALTTLTILLAALPSCRALAAASPATDSIAPPAGRRADPNEPFHVVLWPGGTRIPSIDITNSGTLLAFAQKGGGDLHPNFVEMRRSTDGGKTWARAVDMNNGKKINHANIAPIVDRQTGKVWVFFGERVLNSEQRAYWLKYCHSDDDGLTWSNPETLNIDGKFVVGLPSCNRGIQLSTGRLLLPFTINGLPRTIYSDDHGKSWKFGAFPADSKSWRSVGSSEHAMLELADGRVYMNHRHSGHRAACRVAAFSDDGGMTWSSAVRQKDLPQPPNGCHSGLVRLTHPERDGKSRILYSSPWFGPDGKFVPKDMGRQNLTVQISYDECKTWKPLKRLWEGSSVYSNLIVLPDKSIGCIFESNKPRWQTVHFARFTLDWLTDGQDKILSTHDR